MNLKKELRNRIRQEKKKFPDKEKHRQSLYIINAIERLPLFQEAQSILLYWSLPDEVLTESAANRWLASKNILLPSIKGDEMEIREFHGPQSMVREEKFGIMEPVGNVFADWNAIDLAIIPGVAFDNCNRRLGRGKGYYDRFLKASGAFKVGICYDFQMVERIPVEEHDIPMDMVIHGIS